MTSSELRELVKRHFNLTEANPETVVEETVVEEAFGELEDVNKAFVLRFPGDSPQVGDKVTVVTTEGQEMDAPDGTHEMADGTKIRTENSVIAEIISADGEKELAKEEMMAEEEMIADVVEDVVKDVVEEVVADAVEETVAEAVSEASLEDIVKEIADAVEMEMGKMKEKMAELEAKVDAIEALPAAESTIVKSEMSSVKPKFDTFSVDSAANAERIKLALAEMANFKKK